MTEDDDLNGLITPPTDDQNSVITDRAPPLDKLKRMFCEAVSASDQQRRIAEACDVLGVGRTKLNELMKTDLEVKRIGRNVKIKADSIRAFIARE